MQENIEQQELTRKVEAVKNLPAIVKTRLGFDGALRGALRTQGFDRLIEELEKHLAQLDFESNDQKQEEKIEAFTAFMACVHKYYEDLNRILNPESVSSSSAQNNPLKTSEEVFEASKEYLRALDVFSRDFNRGAYLGNVALISLGAGLCGCVISSLSLYTITFCLFLALALPLATMPPVTFALLLAAPAIFFFEVAAIRAAAFPIRHALGLAPPPVKLTNTFGFFEEAGNMALGLAWGMYEESETTSEVLKASLAPRLP